MIDTKVPRGEPGLRVCDVDPNTDVTDVTNVQISNDGGLVETSSQISNVTDVTEEPSVLIAEEERPCFRVFTEPTLIQCTSLVCRPGVWFFGIKFKNGKIPILTQQWICSLIIMEAVTSDGCGNNFGRLLSFINTLGKHRTWAMPMELLSGSGELMRAELLSMGVQIDPNTHRLLGQYLQSETPGKQVKCVLQVGWCNDSFALPDQVIGPSKDQIIFQSGERHYEEYTTAGTIEGWQAEISKQAVGNPLFILALSLSFSGPLLFKCHMDGGGIHFVGDSSTGKTTLIEAACSIWGGSNFRRSWRTTANGLEGAAAMFNDGLLALDEISECNPHEVGAIIYSLGNGRGKQRASRTGSARAIVRWRCAVLSSGERSIDTTMLEGGNKIKSGQTVRLLNLPVSRKEGAWDNLHQHASGAAFSDSIKQACIAHHGLVGRAFLEKLTHDQRDFSAHLEQCKNLSAFSSNGGEGQYKRVASRFALIAMAGELATEYGLTGWSKGDAVNAAAEALAQWGALNGSDNNERWQILEQVADFIDKNCDSRFSRIMKRSSGGYAYFQEEQRVNQRAGYWIFDGSDSDARRLYFFNAGAMREALSGFDFNKALDVLEDAGVFPLGKDSKGERAKNFRIQGGVARYYQIDPNKLRPQGVDHD